MSSYVKPENEGRCSAGRFYSSTVQEFASFIIMFVKVKMKWYARCRRGNDIKK